MTKQLIEIPDYAPNRLNYILETRLVINEIVRDTQEKPIMPMVLFSGLDRKQIREIKLQFNRYYSKFIYKQYSTNQDGSMRILMNDPLFHLNEIMVKHRKLKFGRFISEKEDKLVLKHIPKDIDSLHIETKYLVIREQIISYIEQKLGRKHKDVKELKKLFITKSELSFDDFLDKKSKMLSRLDLKGYVKDLNKQTDKRRK